MVINSPASCGEPGNFLVLQPQQMRDPAAEGSFSCPHLRDYFAAFLGIIRKKSGGKNMSTGTEQRQMSAEKKAEVIKDFGQTDVAGFQSDIHCISIIGQVEGHMILPPQNKTTKYEHIIPQLVAVEENPAIKGLLVVLNTVGGDVEAGLAIAEMIASMSKPSVSIVLGGCHSIGVPIAVATDYSLLAHTATMTIHPIRLSGLVIGVPQTYEYLDKMQDRVVRFVTSHSRITDAKFRELMFRTGELARDIGTSGGQGCGGSRSDRCRGRNKAVAELRPDRSEMSSPLIIYRYEDYLRLGKPLGRGGDTLDGQASGRETAGFNRHGVRSSSIPAIPLPEFQPGRRSNCL